MSRDQENKPAFGAAAFYELTPGLTGREFGEYAFSEDAGIHIDAYPLDSASSKFEWAFPSHGVPGCGYESPQSAEASRQLQESFAALLEVARPSLERYGTGQNSQMQDFLVEQIGEIIDASGPAGANNFGSSGTGTGVGLAFGDGGGVGLQAAESARSSEEEECRQDRWPWCVSRTCHTKTGGAICIPALRFTWEWPPGMKEVCVCLYYWQVVAIIAIIAIIVGPGASALIAAVRASIAAAKLARAAAAAATAARVVIPQP